MVSGGVSSNFSKLAAKTVYGHLGVFNSLSPVMWDRMTPDGAGKALNRVDAGLVNAAAELAKVTGYLTDALRVHPRVVSRAGYDADVVAMFDAMRSARDISDALAHRPPSDGHAVIGLALGLQGVIANAMDRVADVRHALHQQNLKVVPIGGKHDTVLTLV